MGGVIEMTSRMEGAGLLTQGIGVGRSKLRVVSS